MKSFLGLLVGLAALAALAWTGLFLLAQAPPDEPFRNALLGAKSPWVFSAQNQGPESWRWLQVQQNDRGHLVEVASGEELPLLLAKTGPQFLALTVLESKADIHEQIATAFGAEWDEKVLVMSEYEVVINAIQRLKPRWAYAWSRSDELRWKMYDSVGLLGLARLKRDCLVLTPRDSRGVEWSPRLIAEAQRRNLCIVAGPLETESDVSLAKSWQAHGFLIRDENLRGQIN